MSIVSSAAVVGVGVNPLAPTVADVLCVAAHELGVGFRRIELSSLRCTLGGEAVVEDSAGPVHVTHLAPALLYWQEAAVHALDTLERSAAALNPVAASLRADDKAVTAALLAAAGVAQVRTWVVSQHVDQVLAAAEEIGYPVVVKRTHGAQGRWVRLAEHPAHLREVHEELVAEGRGALVLQRFVAEAKQRNLRVIVTGGQVIAASERVAAPGELQSNIRRGGSQHRVELSDAEAALARAATEVLGLGHAGVDLLHTSAGPAVLEVNACPEFTSMREVADVDLARCVIEATLRAS